LKNTKLLAMNAMIAALYAALTLAIFADCLRVRADDVCPR